MSDAEMPKFEPITSEEIAAASNAYALAVGNVTAAWNLLQEELAAILVAVTAINADIALSIWYSSDNDRTQRNMLRAAVLARRVDKHFRGDVPIIDDLLWLIDRANVIANERNNVTHTPIQLQLRGEAGPDFSASLIAYVHGHPRARGLYGRLLLAEFESCANKTNTLISFAKQLGYSLSDSEKPWPERPALPSPRQKTSPPNQPRPPRTKLRQRQRRSSQA